VNETIKIENLWSQILYKIPIGPKNGVKEFKIRWSKYFLGSLYKGKNQKRIMARYGIRR